MIRLLAYFLLLTSLPLITWSQDTTFCDANWKECNPSGATYLHTEFRNGKQITYTDYYLKNRQRQNTGQYLNGKETGTFIWYDEEGRQIEERNYDEGYLHGKYIEWHPNGRVKTLGNYAHGRPEGEWISYTHRGKIKEQQTYLIDDRWGNRETPKWEYPSETVEDTSDTGEEDPDPNALILLEKEPSILNMKVVKDSIGYPEAASIAKIQGKVRVKVLVGKQGQMERYIVISDPHPILTKAVTDRLEMLKFTPGILYGRPVKCWMMIPFDFKTF